MPLAETTCVNCGHPVSVLLPTLGQFKDPTGPIPEVALPKAGFVAADGEGRFFCPDCGASQAVLGRGVV